MSPAQTFDRRQLASTNSWIKFRIHKAASLFSVSSEKSFDSIKVFVQKYLSFTNFPSVANLFPSPQKSFNKFADVDHPRIQSLFLVKFCKICKICWRKDFSLANFGESFRCPQVYWKVFFTRALSSSSGGFGCEYFCVRRSKNVYKVYNFIRKDLFACKLSSSSEVPDHKLSSLDVRKSLSPVKVFVGEHFPITNIFLVGCLKLSLAKTSDSNKLLLTNISDPNKLPIQINFHSRTFPIQINFRSE